MANEKSKVTADDINPNANKDQQASDIYKKLPDNPDASAEDNSVSTADDSANGKYSKTGMRKEEINKSTTRGGS